MAELVISPLKKLEMININSRSCHISFIEVNGIPAQFTNSEFMVSLTPPTQNHLRELRTLGSYWKISQIAASRGELCIAVPKQIQEKMEEFINKERK